MTSQVSATYQIQYELTTVIGPVFLVLYTHINYMDHDTN